MNENALIKSCLSGDRTAQRMMYERFAAKMFGVCRRYIKNEADVEEVLLNGFYKVFSNLAKFSHKGSFEGWIRRIMVNEALMFIRKQNKVSNLQLVGLADYQHPASPQMPDRKIQEDDILCLLDDLPPGYRTVFNLYAIEGYSHKEIAEKLGVSVNTSKSQLLKARRMLQELLEKADIGRE